MYFKKIESCFRKLINYFRKVPTNKFNYLYSPERFRMKTVEVNQSIFCIQLGFSSVNFFAKIVKHFKQFQDKKIRLQKRSVALQVYH